MYQNIKPCFSIPHSVNSATRNCSLEPAIAITWNDTPKRRNMNANIAANASSPDTTWNYTSRRFTRLSMPKQQATVGVIWPNWLMTTVQWLFLNKFWIRFYKLHHSHISARQNKNHTILILLYVNFFNCTICI